MKSSFDKPDNCAAVRLINASNLHQYSFVGKSERSGLRYLPWCIARSSSVETFTSGMLQIWLVRPLKSPWILSAALLQTYFLGWCSPLSFLTSPEQPFRLKIPPSRINTEATLEESMLKIPVFHQSEHGIHGVQISRNLAFAGLYSPSMESDNRRYH